MKVQDLRDVKLRCDRFRSSDDDLPVELVQNSMCYEI